MKTALFFFFCLVSAGILAQSAKESSSPLTRRIPFDNGWLFTSSQVSNAEQPEFPDSGWRRIDLPHDWSIEDLPNPAANGIMGPFSKNSAGANATGYTVGGTGWYRKKFQTTKLMQGKKLTLFFDGVYMNADVWLNGHHLGNHPYGYTPFYYDLTSFLNVVGRENVISVKVQNEGRNSRWYTGSGIYRHVWLTVTGVLHVSPWGIFITSSEVSNNETRVSINSSVNNDQNTSRHVNQLTTLISPDGKPAGTARQELSLDPNSSMSYVQSISVLNPARWSVEKPNLYKAITEISVGNQIIDRVETVFGIRSISFSAQNGFLLNGKKVLLKGGCIHHDNGPLGSAAIDRAEERKIEILKKNGFNAIRTSHNPPSTALLDACDRLGMLVLDEAFDAWEKGKNPNDYHVYFKDWGQKDIDAMVLRDRNHPSVILWSIGNEIVERVDSPGLRITKELAAEIRRLDPTRPVTEALCTFWDHPGYNWDTTAYAYALLGVGGYNYAWGHYASDHQKFPGRIMMGTESYAVEALESWNAAENLPYVLGDFVWTAFDYLGEASIGHSSIDKVKGGKFWMGWPWFNAYCGDIDLIGNKKPQSYYRDVVWRNSPITMLVHGPLPDGLVENVSGWGWPDESASWTWPGSEGKILQVRVFSRAP
ncbi:MAG: glycoside hydrolase family 2 TIM barrel-domain containing protein, partial [Chitinophagales bacterium]